MPTRPSSKCSISDRGITFIARHEGFKPLVYKDPAGIPTVGFGHKLTQGEQFAKPLSHEEAMTILRTDIAKAEKAVHAHVDVVLTQAQHDALVSFVFNVGDRAFARSTLLRQLNAGNYRRAADELLRWSKMRLRGVITESPGLVARRAAERMLFMESVHESR